MALIRQSAVTVCVETMAVREEKRQTQEWKVLPRELMA